MRRHIIFGHRSYDSVLDAMLSGKPFAAMSGFMPSGHAHLGHKMVMEEIIWHQQQGGDAFLAIADMEAHAVRGKTWKECREYGINEYILSAIAFGLEPGAHIYFQSGSNSVRSLAFELGIKANLSELSAIYGFNGETNIAHMVSALTQSADILNPQSEEFGGPKPVVIPVGADQDPHIRLTRGLANKIIKVPFSKSIKYIYRVHSSVNNKIDIPKLLPIYAKFSGKKYGKDLSCKVDTNDIGLFENYMKQYDYTYTREAKVTAYRVDIKNITNELKNNFDSLIKKYEVNEYQEHLVCYIGDTDVEEFESMIMKFNIDNFGYYFLPPASTYHKFMTGLQGGKMSSSIPESFIALMDKPEDGAKKVMRAKTGGRVTVEEQKKLGGEPDKCTAYELLLYHLVEDDNELLEVYKDCVGGTRVCGNCKKYTAELMSGFLKEHQEKRELAREMLGEFGLQVTKII